MIVTMVSNQFFCDTASYLAPRVLSCLPQWNAVIVIIKCKYLVYPPTFFGINFWLAAEVNLKLVQST